MIETCPFLTEQPFPQTERPAAFGVRPLPENPRPPEQAMARFLDILRRLKSGDSQRRQSYDCNPERVPASTRLPRGTRLGFRRKHSHVGNFTGTNQPPIPPGLTISPQADTACPAAVSPVSKQRQESQNSSQGAPYIPALKSGALRRVEVKLRIPYGGPAGAVPVAERSEAYGHRERSRVKHSFTRRKRAGRGYMVPYLCCRHSQGSFVA